MPNVSVIIPCRDAAATIGDTLDSIRAQSLQDWEALVIDDGSSDETRAIVAEYSATDGRIRLLDNPGRGPSAARNFGALRAARGQIVAFCDADDLWTHGKLAAVVQALDDPCVDAAFGQIAFFDAEPARARTTSTVPQAPVGIETLLGENPVCTLSNLSLRVSTFAATGGFREDIMHNEDLEFLVRLVGGGARLVGLPDLHVFYRASPGGLSADLAAMAAARADVLRSARRFGVTPAPDAEAIYFRYLARRALRLDLGRLSALSLTLKGLRAAPWAFLLPLHRGLGTSIAACAAPMLPRALRRALFTA